MEDKNVQTAEKKDGRVKTWLKNKQVQKVKNHVEKHHEKYILGGVVVGTVVGAVVCRSRVSVASTPVVNVAPVFNNNANATATASAFAGYSRKLVKCVETGQIWESVKDAAEAAGVSASMMSKHINGHGDNISGMKYVIVGLGAGS